MEYEYSEMEIPMWFWVSYAIVFVLMIASMWRVFTKAGQPGWAAIIPIYNIYIMTKIGGKPGHWTLFCLIPLVNFVFIIWLYNMVSKSFGKEEGFTVGLIFLPFIFWPILGFSSAKYLGPFGDPAEFAAHQGKDKFDFEQQQP